MTPCFLRRLQTRTCLLALLTALAACTTGGTQDSGGTDSIFDSVRGHPELRTRAVRDCTFQVARNEENAGFAVLLSGLLDVPADQALGAYCAAMVEASISNEITAQDLKRLRAPHEHIPMQPLGYMLRKVLEAHERLYAQQAQKPPQAQSCGCGQ